MKGSRRSIATLITVGVVVTTTLVLLVFATLFVWQDWRRNRQALADDTTRLTAQLAIALQSPAWNFDRGQLEGLLDSAMQNNAVAAIVVALGDESRSIYARGRDASWRSVPVSTAPTDPALLMAQQPIASAAAEHGSATLRFGEQLGTVTLYTTLRFIQEQVRTEMLSRLLAILLCDLLLIVMLTQLMRWFVLRPLRALREHAADVAAGTDEAAGLVDARFSGEFEQLRESLLKMLELLRERYQALQRQQRRYRQLLTDMLRLQDAEQRRIGRELHDTIGQSLAAVEINLSLLRRSVAADDAGSQQLLDESAQIAKQCLSELRTASYLLHPPLLDELGLATALRWLADGFRERSDIQLHVAIADEPMRLPEAAELALFRVAQEALTNVHRHSGARSAEIRLSRDAESVSLCISDSGHGMPDDASASGGTPAFGVGLAAMRERMCEIGGELQLRSDTTGTVVAATLPLTAAADPALTSAS